MLYHALPAFEKQLSSSGPDHFAPVYMVSLPQGDERRYLLLQIGKKVSSAAPRLIESKALLDEIRSPGFFAPPSTLLICDPIEGIKQLPPLPPGMTLLLGSASLSAFGPIQGLVKQQAVALDMTQEKGWERQKRVRGWLIAQAYLAKKTLHEEALVFLLERVGLEFSLLQNEIEKAIAYVGTRESIERRDCEALSPPATSSATWSTAEGAVWGGVKPLSMLDMSGYLGLLAQVRYHLELGLQLSGGLSPGHIKPYQVEKYQSAARAKGSDYFLKGLFLIAKAEMFAKENYVSALLQWDRLVAQLSS